MLSKSFTVVISPLSTRLIKPNFCFDLSHRRSTTVSLETRNLFIVRCRSRRRRRVVLVALGLYIVLIDCLYIVVLVALGLYIVLIRPEKKCTKTRNYVQ